MELVPLTDEELNDLAIAVVRGEIYIVNDGEALRLSFGHLFQMMEPPLAEGDIEKIGAVYAPYADAGSRSINGHPFFFSMRLLHKDNLQPLIDKVEAKTKALKET